MKTIERIKTVLFAGLFASAVILAAVYIAGTPGHDKADGRNLPVEVQAVLRGSDSPAADTLQTMQLIPSFLGIKQTGGQAMGLASGVSMMRDLGGLLSPWLAFALGSEAVCLPLSGEEGNALWRASAASETYFYLRWSEAMPATLLRAHCAPEDSGAMLDLAAGRLPRIAEIFFFPGVLPEKLAAYGNGEVCAVSRDEAGGVSLWLRARGEKETLTDFDDFSIYIARGILSEYSFAGADHSVYVDELVTLPLFVRDLTLNELQSTYPFADVEGERRMSEALLTIFNCNLNKVGSYYESETDTAVFVETHGTLRASADKIFYEATASGGLPVTDFVRETDVNALTLFDDLVACEALVEAIRQADRSLIGGDAIPGLTAVYAEGETLVLEYAYFYENIRMESAAPALMITLREHRIVSVELRVISCLATEKSARAGGQEWMLRLAGYLHLKQQGGHCLIALRYAAVEGDAGRLRADWSVYLYD